LRKRFIKTFVRSILLYTSKIWTIEKKDRARIEAAEMWMWRRMTKTRWIDKKSNKKVLEEVDERRQLMKSINSRKIKLVGHLMRNNDFITNIFEGKVAGKMTKGKPLKKYFEEIQKSMNCKKFHEMKNVALDRRSGFNDMALPIEIDDVYQKINDLRVILLFLFIFFYFFCSLLTS
jgi:hypothetical protein